MIDRYEEIECLQMGMYAGSAREHPTPKRFPLSFPFARVPESTRSKEAESPNT